MNRKEMEKRLDLYRQTIASLVKQAGGEIVVTLIEDQGTLLNKLDPDQEHQVMKVRYRFVKDAKNQ